MTESWQRPPFEPGNQLGATAGNQLAVTHGAYSSRVVDPRAQAILAELTADRPVWLEDVDMAALDAWAVAEARCTVLREYTSKHGLVDGKGKTTSAADLLLRSERLAADLRGRLGFDPLSRARLGKDTASARLDLARMWADEGEPS